MSSTISSRAVLSLILLLSPAVFAQQDSSPMTIARSVQGMDKIEGFFDLYWDESTGNIFWEIDRVDQEFLYQVSLASGLGSNPVGLDRGQLGMTAILKPVRVGPKILLMEPNYRYRAISDNQAEVRAVQDAFAPSVHWGFQIVAESGESVLVDATDFFLRDTHGVTARISRAGQGAYKLDPSRSAFYLAKTKGFPKNTEVETMLTFVSTEPGRLVQSVAASGETVTLRQHHSLVELPDDDFELRAADPRIGVFGPTIHDYATPINESLIKRLTARHRIKKKDPSAARSEPIEPIVYYVDNGVPEPIRSALVDGASWWNQAFEAAGFIDGFQVRVLPDDADPQDIRYNMIHWTHRSTRGWSYGGGVQDPRTGEIIKGNVNLGSLRLRQDYLIGTSVMPPFTTEGGLDGCGLSATPGFAYLAQASGAADPTQMALARVRQLSAHEVGHTLGFPHNYMASTYGGRASVMDYPAPYVQIRGDRIVLDDAYAVGIGDYDKLSVRWLYTDFSPDADVNVSLNAIVDEGLRNEVRFMAHTDNYIGAGAHPLASVWDNGADLVQSLRHEIEVRRLGLEGFGDSVIRQGEPMSMLERVLVPLYLHHRFQMKAAMNSIAGAEYYYAVRGDGQTPVTIVPAQRQREALDAVLETMTAEFLAIPERIVQLIPPPAYRYDQGESFPGHTGLLFDPLTAATTSADFTMDLLLHPERMARLVEYHARDEGQLGLSETIERVIDTTWHTQPASDSYHRQVQEIARQSVVDALLTQASAAENPPRVRAILSAALVTLADEIDGQADPSAHSSLVASDVRRWQQRPEGVIPGSDKPEIPPGSPIGN